MNLLTAVQDYITRMISEVSGMKVMIFDRETSGIVSMVLSQSEILAKDVFLTELLDSEKREKMSHLKAIVFVRPTATNITRLKKELREPHYGEYHLFFSNVVKSSYIEELAHGDENEIVRQVQEYFADYYAVNSHLFSINMRGLAPHSIQDSSLSETHRIVEGITACLLSLKKQPTIRYQQSSALVEHVAKLVWSRIEEERELFHQLRRTESAPLLLLLDRRDDPVTPLLTQWTYQAMVHELLGIANHRVSIRNKVVRKDMREIVMATHQDEFYAKNVDTNFGDLGINVKALVDDYQAKHQRTSNIESIEDMQNFVENYPEFRKLSGNVSKHVTVMSELSRLIEEGNLMEVSQAEQHLACTEGHSEAVKNLRELLANPNVHLSNKLRLTMLYALRYEDRGSSEMMALVELLKESGADTSQVRTITELLDYAGSKKRGGDLFSNKNLTSRLTSTVTALKGVSNVYTQHNPLLQTILNNLSNNRLKESLYPSLDMVVKDKPQEVIVFMLGGTTYEEAVAVKQFNESNVGMHVILGGTTIHNSDSFIRGIKRDLMGGVDLH